MSILLSHERYVPPGASNFSTLIGTNSVNPTITDSAPNSGTTGDGTVFHFGASVATGDNVRCALKSISVASGTIIARIRQMPIAWEFTTSGLALSDGTKIIMFGYGWPQASGSLNGPVVVVEKWNSATSFSATSTTIFQSGGTLEWWKITFSANQPTAFYVSNDGVNWIEVFGALSGFLTSISKAGVGIHINNNVGAPALGSDFGFLNLLYYSDPDISPSV